MKIFRDDYIAKLVSKSWNGRVKIVTGIRRCGKSYLLNNLFREYLMEHNVQEDEIISIDLEKKSDIRFRNPNALYDHVISKTQDRSRKYYVFIDEIQMSLKIKNPDFDLTLTA